MRPTPYDFAAACRLLAPVEWTGGGGLIAAPFLHDHDEELGMYWYQAERAQPSCPSPRQYPLPDRNVPSPPPSALRSTTLEDAREVIHLTRELRRSLGLESRSVPRRRRPRDDAYWEETARLVKDYFELLAGVHSETLLEGFVAWLKRSPGECRQYKEGDDMSRAALVDWYLKLVR